MVARKRGNVAKPPPGLAERQAAEEAAKQEPAEARRRDPNHPDNAPPPEPEEAAQGGPGASDALRDALEPQPPEDEGQPNPPSDDGNVSIDMDDQDKPMVGLSVWYVGARRRAGVFSSAAVPALITGVNPDGSVSLTLFEVGRISFASKVGTNRKNDHHWRPHR